MAKGRADAGTDRSWFAHPPGSTVNGVDSSDIEGCLTSRKRLHNAVGGDIELTGEALELAGDGLTINAYTADSGSPTEDQLRLLATWTTTHRTT